MSQFRTKFLAALLFGLITLGQAYPFATAWGMKSTNHPCCCSSDKAKPCDCDHSGHSKKFSCHSQSGPGYAASPCGSHQETQSLNFQGEHCLPRFTQSVMSFGTFTKSELPVFILPNYQGRPESPPPKFVSHSIS